MSRGPLIIREQKTVDLVLRTTTASQTTGLPLTGNVDVLINWGDGNTTHETSDIPTHEYLVAGDYSVSIDITTLNMLNYQNGTYGADIIKVNDLGNNPWTYVSLQNTRNLTDFVCGENFNTSNITTMNNMFFYCSSLTTIDLSNFNTTNVTDIAGMFAYCSSLTTINVTNFNTTNVTDISAMFAVCSSLTTIDITNFNTTKMTTIDNLFAGCSSLTTIDLSNFNTSNVTQMQQMFDNCSSLTTLDLSNFNTSNVIDMERMFHACGNNLCVTANNNFTTTQLPNVPNMFLSSSITHPTTAEQADLTDVNGATYSYSGC